MQTLGQRLKAAREEKNLTLEKVFQAIRIRVNHLQALEDLYEEHFLTEN